MQKLLWLCLVFNLVIKIRLKKTTSVIKGVCFEVGPLFQLRVRIAEKEVLFMKSSQWVQSSVAVCLMASVLIPQARAEECSLSTRTASDRIREVDSLILRGNQRLSRLNSELARYQRNLDAMETSVAAGRISFAISMAGVTLALGGGTVFMGSLATGPISTGGIGALITQIATAGATAGLASVTAGMAYGSYRTIRSVQHSWTRGGHSAQREGHEAGPSQEETAEEFLSLILDPNSSGAPQVRETFAAVAFDPVRNFLEVEQCESQIQCSPTPPGFSEALQAAEQVHQRERARFERSVSSWLPEVITNREARLLAEVKIPYVENLIQQAESSQAYYAAVRNRLANCVR